VPELQPSAVGRSHSRRNWLLPSRATGPTTPAKGKPRAQRATRALLENSTPTRAQPRWSLLRLSPARLRRPCDDGSRLLPQTSREAQNNRHHKTGDDKRQPKGVHDFCRRRTSPGTDSQNGPSYRIVVIGAAPHARLARLSPPGL
jgi:hypothetical protein